MSDALVAVFLVLTFGWTGSPGAWQVWAEALRVWHSSRGSADPGWDGPEAFDSFMVVDDGAIVEPDLGQRQLLSAQAWEDGLAQLLGPKALNLEKLTEEGEFLAERILWGLTTNVNSMTVSLPDHKISRAQFVMDDPVYDPGRRRIRVRDLQVLRGNAQRWSLAQPRLKPELAAIDRMLTGVTIDQERVQDRGDAEWEEFEDTVEYMRVLVGCPHLWTATFRSSFVQVLTPAERWSLPNGPPKIWTGGDATKLRVGFTDWSAGICFSESVAPFMELFRAELGPAVFEGEEDVIIALCELLAILLGTIRQMETWRGTDVIYVSDNSNVVTWLRSRRTPHRWARYMLRMMTRIEINYDFTLAGVYVRTVRTAHNTFNDDLTRIEPSLLPELAKAEGVVLVPHSTAVLAEVMEAGWQSRLASFPGAPPELNELATRLRDRRLSRGGPPEDHEIPDGLVVTTWRAGPGGVGSAAIAKGAAADVVPTGPSEKRWCDKTRPSGAPGCKPDIAFTAALSGPEAFEGMSWVAGTGARVVCVTMPPEFSSETVLDHGLSFGFRGTVETQRAVEFGDSYGWCGKIWTGVSKCPDKFAVPSCAPAWRPGQCREPLSVADWEVCEGTLERDRDPRPDAEGHMRIGRVWMPALISVGYPVRLKHELGIWQISKVESTHVTVWSFGHSKRVPKAIVVPVKVRHPVFAAQPVWSEASSSSPQGRVSCGGRRLRTSRRTSRFGQAEQGGRRVAPRPGP